MLVAMIQADMSVDCLVSSYVSGAPLMCLVTLVLVAMF